jgi:L-ascorbate metabolism protein UlaG (beta-lactamase superfamily)
MKKIIRLLILACSVWIGSCSSNDNEKKCEKPTASAGDDQVLVDQTSATLAGTSSENNAGTWSIVKGQGGEIHSDGGSMILTGVAKASYELKWQSDNACGSASDLVDITFNVSCGDDQTLDDLVANMHWIEQSCFRIESGPFTIYTDPISITKKDTADIIVITHPHDDHYTAADLDKISGPNTIIIAPQDVIYNGTYGQRIVLTPGNTYTAFGCVTIKAVNAYNINKNFHLKSYNWVGYLITVNGQTIYHAGDTERIPEMKDITCDVAILPLGQTYTFDTVDDAAEAAKDVHAKVAIPMHYALHEGTADDAITFKTLLDGIIPVVIKEKRK